MITDCMRPRVRGPIPFVLALAAAAAGPLMAPGTARAAPAGAASTAAAPAGADEAARLKLATVNGEAITLAGLRESFESRHAGHGALIIGEEILKAVLEQAIGETLIVQEGRRMGIPDEPEFKDAVTVYRDLLRLRLLEERAILKPSGPTAAQVKQTYALLPRQMRLFLLDAREKDQAEAALRRVRGGESFEAVAREVSTHQSRVRGGDLGWITWGVLDPVTEGQAMKGTAGSIAGPFAAEGKWRLLHFVEVKKGEPPPFDKVEQNIRAILRNRRQADLRRDLLASIQKAHPPREDALLVARLLFAPRNPAARPDPPDEAVLLRTATGLELTAGRVRARARGLDGGLQEAWETGRDDALLIDEARRRITATPDMERKVKVYGDGRIRQEVEASVILKGITIGEAEVRALYDRDPAAFAGSSRHHLRQIVLATRPEAEEVRRLLASGGDFAELARTRSIDPATAPKGGDLGWVDGPRPGQDAADGVFALQSGAISDVLEMGSGFAVVQALEVQAPVVPAFEKVREEAAQRVMIRAQKDRREAFVARLREHATVQIHETAFKRAVAIQDEAARRRLTPQPAAPGGRG